MDLSEKYIKMCQKAIELQEFSQPLEAGDFYGYETVSGFRGEACTADSGGDYGYITYGNIWLPRIDQLQEMVVSNDNPQPAFRILERLKNYFLDYAKYFETLQCETMEKVWLRIVMLDIYEKVWNPEKEEWIQLS